MAAFLSLTLAELLTYYPTLLPTLLIYPLESAQSAKFWEAIQRLPIPKHTLPANSEETDGSDPQQKNRVLVLRQESPTRTSRLVKAAAPWLIGVFFGLFVTGGHLVPASISKDITKLRIFYLCILEVPITLLVLSSLRSISGLVVPLVTRKLDGQPMVTKKDESTSSYPTICFAAVGSLVAADAIWFGHPPAVMVVYAALIHVVFRNNISSGKTTLRFLFYSAGFLISLAAFLSIFLTATKYSAKQPTTFNWPLSLSTENTTALVDWQNIFLSPLWSSPLFSILSMSYRLDHANSLPPHSVHPDVTQPTTGLYVRYRFGRRPADADADAAAQSKSKSKSPPKPSKFPTPYFHAALAATSLSYTAIAALSVAGVLRVTYEALGVVALYLAFPATCLAVLALAVCRGQLREVWSYEEDWGAAPAGSVSHGGGGEAGADAICVIRGVEDGGCMGKDGEDGKGLIASAPSSERGGHGAQFV